MGRPKGSTNKTKKAAFTFESNSEKILAAISEVPGDVMKTIGQNLAREIRANEIKNQYDGRRKILAKALQWAWDYDLSAKKKNKAGIQIGFKASVEKNKQGKGPGLIGDIMTGQQPDPIKPAVLRNKDLIQDVIARAIQQITKR